MHSIRPCVAAIVAIFLAACGQTSSSEPAVLEQVRSVQSISITDDEGQEQTLLIAGVRGPDRDASPDAARQARQVVDDLLDQAELSHQAVGDPDRYNRIPSRVTLGEDLDLARTLVDAGWVMVWPRVGQDVPYDALLEAEATARAAGSGAWGQGVFTVRDPDPNRLAQHLDSAQIVEGRVIDVGSARDGRVFVNFGLDWRTDLTAVADEDAVERFNEAGLDLQDLEGTIIRVRGWMFELNGPSITLSHPAQIEVVDAPPKPELPR